MLLSQSAIAVTLFALSDSIVVPLSFSGQCTNLVSTRPYSSGLKRRTRRSHSNILLPFLGCTVMVVPHFGDYIAFKLDPVASLKYLKDPEVTKACEALKTTVYVACVTHVRLLPACRGSPSTNLYYCLQLFSFPLPGVEYISVSMTLVSQGLSDGQLDRFILPDMAVPILPNNSNPAFATATEPYAASPLARLLPPYPYRNALSRSKRSYRWGPLARS